jgi:hypothetical protein
MVSRFHGKPDYNLAEMETETTEMDGILRIRRRLQGD